ncbi:MAG: hypothetical protein ACN6NT_07600, partial [Comamonas sp.]
MNQKDTEFSSIISEQTDRLLKDLFTHEVLVQSESGIFPAELWRQVQASGMTSALVDENAGGMELSAADAFEIIRLTGYRAASMPIGNTMLATAFWVAQGGSLDDFANAPARLAPLITSTAPNLALSGSGYGSAHTEPPSGWVLSVAKTVADQYLVTLAQESCNEFLALQRPQSLHLQHSALNAVHQLPCSVETAHDLLFHAALGSAMQMVGA